MNHSAAVLALVCAGALVAPLDTAVNVAFPAIVSAFGVTPGEIQWVVLPFVIAQSLATVLFGRLGDLHGHRRIFMLGMVACVLAHGAVALAPDYPTLIGLRALQGVAVGLALACAPALVSLSSVPERRPQVLALYATALSGGLVLGPLAGGLLVERLGWPGVFLFRVPLAFVVALLAPVVLRSVGEGGGREAAGMRPRIAWEALRSRRFIGLQSSSIVIQSATFAILLWGPFALSGWGDGSAGWAGALIALYPLGALLAGLGVARGPWQPGPAHSGALVLIGQGLAVAGLAGCATALGIESSWLLAPMLLLAGAGLGCFQAGYVEQTIRRVPPDNRGLSGSLVNVTRLLGIVLGVVALSAVGKAFGPVLAMAAGAAVLALWTATSYLLTRPT